MKKCHACGQRLPWKVGDVVEMRTSRYGGTKAVRGTGILTKADPTLSTVVTFRGKETLHPTALLVRLHGYFRITERETL